MQQREGTYEFVPRNYPPTIDEMVEAMRKERLCASQNVREALNIALERPIEQFNFGLLSLETIREAQREAIEFIEYGCYTLPYPVCMYRASIQYHNTVAGFSILLIDRYAEPEHVLSSAHYGIATISMVHSNYEMCAIHCINMLNVKEDVKGKAVELQIPKREIEFWETKIDLGNMMPDENGHPVSISQMTEGAILAMGLTMILNTKGVRKERNEPARKPQQARIKAGKPLLPYVTRVYTDVYNRAVVPGTGTHASPRPHRRRAHVRHMPAVGAKPPYNIPIAAMLVNWDGSPLARGQYEVK